MSIFKENDVRGIYPSELSCKIAYGIGKSLIQYTRSRKIAIGRDGRLSSDELFQAISQGVVNEARVIDLGVCSSDMFCCMVNKYGFDTGVMITASHNPAEYNGFKFVRKHALSFVSRDVRELERIFRESECSGYEKDRSVDCERKGSYKEFARYLMREGRVSLREIRDVFVVVDAGNGVAGLTFPAVFDQINMNGERIHYIPLYFRVDGRFPNHEANPMKKENLRDLGEMVKRLNRISGLSERRFFGIASDGDGDRAGYLDEKGEFVHGDLVFALIARNYLRQNPGKRVACDLRTSVAVIEDIKENSGSIEITPVGYSFVKDTMKKREIEIGGEVSNHYHFALDKNFILDSGTLASLRLFEIMSRERKGLSELVDPLRRYPRTGELNVESSGIDAGEMLSRVREVYSRQILYDIDGITIARGLDRDKSPLESGWYWFNVRKSKTEPILRFNIEAENRDILRQVKNSLEELLGLEIG